MKRCKHTTLTTKDAKLVGDCYKLRCAKCKRLIGFYVSAWDYHKEYMVEKDAKRKVV